MVPWLNPCSEHKFLSGLWRLHFLKNPKLDPSRPEGFDEKFQFLSKNVTSLRYPGHSLSVVLSGVLVTVVIAISRPTSHYLEAHQKCHPFYQLHSKSYKKSIRIAILAT